VPVVRLITVVVGVVVVVVVICLIDLEHKDTPYFDTTKSFFIYLQDLENI
jgi:hypothetical protein